MVVAVAALLVHLGDHVGGEVDDLLEVLGREVEQVPERAGRQQLLFAHAHLAQRRGAGPVDQPRGEPRRLVGGGRPAALQPGQQFLHVLEPPLDEPLCVQVCACDALVYAEREEEVTNEETLEEIEVGLQGPEFRPSAREQGR